MKWVLMALMIMGYNGIALAEDYTVSLSTDATQETTLGRMFKRACSAAASSGETSYAGCTITDGVCVSCSPSVGERETFLLGVLNSWLTSSQNTLIGAELNHINSVYGGLSAEDQDSIKTTTGYSD